MRCLVAVDPRRWTLADAEELVEAIRRQAADRGLADVELVAFESFIRYVARRAGFVGGLRDPLRWSPIAEAAPPDFPSLVPHVAVGPATNPRRSRLARRASTGNAGSVRYMVRLGDDQELRLVLPEAEDVLVENVARTLDTADAVCRRFPTDTRNIQGIAFDESDHGLRYGRLVGEAVPGTRVIHVTAAYASASAMGAWRERLRDQGQAEVWLHLGGPFNQVDATVAHEMWHLIDASFSARRYRDSIEFRRRLGEYFGMPTLEHVTHPVRGTDPEAAAAAKARLQQEVSPYAATRALEATAEMFKYWWCATQPPTGVVAVFGALLTEFGLDATASPRE